MFSRDVQGGDSSGGSGEGRKRKNGAAAHEETRRRWMCWQQLWRVRSWKEKPKFGVSWEKATAQTELELKEWKERTLLRKDLQSSLQARKSQGGWHRSQPQDLNRFQGHKSGGTLVYQIFVGSFIYSTLPKQCECSLFLSPHSASRSTTGFKQV